MHIAMSGVRKACHNKSYLAFVSVVWDLVMKLHFRCNDHGRIFYGIKRKGGAEKEPG